MLNLVQIYEIIMVLFSIELGRPGYPEFSLCRSYMRHYTTNAGMPNQEGGSLNLISVARTKGCGIEAMLVLGSRHERSGIGLRKEPNVVEEVEGVVERIGLVYEWMTEVPAPKSRFGLAASEMTDEAIVGRCRQSLGETFWVGK